MLRSEILQRWWPSTQSLDLVEGPVETVARNVREHAMRFWHGELTAAWEAFPDLGAAFASAEYFANVPTVVLVMPTHSKWSVLWNNSYRFDGYDSLCACLTRFDGMTTLSWSAHDATTSELPGSHFEYRRMVDGREERRCVYASLQGSRWYFEQCGDPLPEEDTSAYEARRKRDRLDEEQMARLLGALGAYPWQEDFYAIPGRPAFALRRTEPFPGSIVRRSIEEALRTRSNGEPEGDGAPRSPALERITERVTRYGEPSPTTRACLLTISEFFDGNDVVGSIGVNLPGAPHPDEIRSVLEEILARPDVADVRVEVRAFDDPEWPFSDLVWVVSSATAEEVARWFPGRLAPDAIGSGWDEDREYEECPVPAGHTPYACFWD